MVVVRLLLLHGAMEVLFSGGGIASWSFAEERIKRWNGAMRSVSREDRERAFRVVVGVGAMGPGSVCGLAVAKRETNGCNGCVAACDGSGNVLRVVRGCDLRGYRM